MTQQIEITTKVITEKDLSLINDNVFNAKQMQLLLANTPARFVKQRPAKGGGTWSYVSGGYVRKVLNLLFGFDWDFEILSEQIMHGEAVVKGKLTVRSGERVVSKMQYGNKEITYKNDYQKYIDEKGVERFKKIKTDEVLSIGNDLKAAATDCLKKCAAELGVANDIYNEDFVPVRVETLTSEDLATLFDEVKMNIPAEYVEDIERIINNNEVASFKRAYEFMKGLQGGGAND